MIRTVIQCEHCLEQKDVQSDVLRKMPAPGWFTVSPIDEPALAYHFCSKGCLCHWAQQVAPSPDWELLNIKQLEAVTHLRERITTHIDADMKLFGLQYPGIDISWSFSIEPYDLTGKNSCLREAQKVKKEACCNEAQSCRP